MTPKRPYTAIIRRSELEYVGLCLELNVSARGADLPEVEANLKNAINDYLEYATETKLALAPISVEGLVEFLRDTSLEGKYAGTKGRRHIYQPLELNEVPFASESYKCYNSYGIHGTFGTLGTFVPGISFKEEKSHVFTTARSSE